MPAKRRSAARVRTPARAFESRFGSHLFYESDIPKLAIAAGLSVGAWADHSRLAKDLDRAFFAAHAADYNVSNEPSTAELRDGYGGAAKAGRELLLALGVKAEPAALLSESYVDILDHSSVLRALVQVIPPDICKLLHREVVEALAPRYPMNFEPRRKLVAHRQIVESLRTVAFVVVAAEAARSALPNPTRHGPRRAVFAPVLLDSLSIVIG